MSSTKRNIEDFWYVANSSGLPVAPKDESGHEDYGMLVYQSEEAAIAAAKHQECWFGPDEGLPKAMRLADCPTFYF